MKRAALTLAFLAPAALAACFGGCTNPEEISPVGTPPTATTTTPEPTTPPDDGGPPPHDAGPPKRTVMLRNPLGDGPANNLLLDGDFELSSSYGTGQYGWRMFDASGSGEMPLVVQTGGRCRSGLLCVKLVKGQILYGRGTAAAGGKGHVMALYARLSEGALCSRLNVLAVECDTFVVKKKATADKELSDGWCHYKGTFGPSSASMCMYLQSTLQPEQEAVIDAAVLGPNDGTVPLEYIPDEPVDAESLARMARLRDFIRRTTPFGKPPVTAPPPLR